MIEITEFFESKICRINIVVLKLSILGQNRKSCLPRSLTFPLGKPSSLRISKIRFSVFPEANVLLMLRTTMQQSVMAFRQCSSPTFERESSCSHSA